MKKSFPVIFFLFLSLAGGYTAGCSSKNTDGAKEKSAAEILPESTEFMLRLPSAEKICSLFSVTENSIMGRPVKKIAELKEKWGFHPLLPDELRKRGFDTAREISISADNFQWPGHGGDPLMDLLLLLPVTDGKKALDAVQHYLKNENPETVFTSEDGLLCFQSPGKAFRGAMIEKKGHLLIAFNEQSEVRDFIRSVLQSESSLKNAGHYRDIVSRMDAGKNFFLYADFGKIIRNNYETLKMLSEKKSGNPPGFAANLEYLKDYEGCGITLDAEQSDLHVKGLLQVREGSDFLKISENARFNKKTVLGIPKNAAVLISTAVDFAEYYRIIKSAMSAAEKSAWENRLADFRGTYNTDAEKEIFSNIEGNLNMGIYDGRSINMSNYNLLATLSLKDGEKMQEVLEKMYQSLTPEQQIMIRKDKTEETDAYVMTFLGIIQVYAGVKDENLILALGYPIFDMALRGDIAGGFLSETKDKELVRHLQGDKGIFYANIPEIYRAANNFSFLMQQFNMQQGGKDKSGEAVRDIEYLLISTHTEKNSFGMDLICKTAFSSPFFQGIRKVVEE